MITNKDITQQYEVKQKLMAMFNCTQEELQADIDSSGLKERSPLAYKILSTQPENFGGVVTAAEFKGFTPKRK